MVLAQVRRALCLLCGARLTPVSATRQRHPKRDTCLVTLTDNWGVSAEPEPELEAEPETDFVVEGIVLYPSVESVLKEIFEAAKLPRLGGISSGRGWSGISLFQRCPYAWFRRHLAKKQAEFMPTVAPPALEIGILVHTFLAIYYTRMITPDYPLTPEAVYEAARFKGNPELIAEGWRVFTGYRLYYMHENIMPLAIEHDLKDPRTGESCRYDLIAFFPEDEPGSGTRRDGILPGTWEVEHKTAGRFDDATLNGWANDGEVIGQVMLWERLGLDKRFGPLRGAMVNILGKQPKDQRFHRTRVAAPSWQTAQHAADLRSWEAQIRAAQASNHFPRARGNCIGRFGKCSEYEHCATTEG